MTPQEATQRYRMELCGLVADAAASHRTGGELALYLRRSFARIDAILAEFQLIPLKPAVTNGPPAAPAAQPQRK